MTAFIQLYLASMKEFVRDRMTIFWTLLFPVMFIVLFGLIFSSSSNASFDVGLVLEDQGQVGAQLAIVFRNISVLKVHEGDREDELAALGKGERRAVIVLPAGLSAAVAQKQPASLTLYTDPAQQQAAQIVLGVTQQVLQEAERRINGTPVLLSVEQKSALVTQPRFIDLFVPAMIAMALMQLGLFATAQPVVQLREQGVLRRLGATPLPRVTILASQTAMRLTIALLQTAVIISLGAIIFHVPVSGNWAAVIALVMLGGLMFIALGYVIAGFSKNQESAAGISSVLNFPMMFLSGLFIPLEVMPSFLRPVANVIPLTYLVDALRQQMAGATPAHPLALDVAIMTAWLVASLAVAVRFFKWE
ncbi:MAG: ABC transporter permease [Chloroflexi bacterium]|nr:ABC transporter permease [Chloroflexota bacterium]